MIEHFTTYLTATGEIVMTGNGATGIAAQQEGLIAGTTTMIGDASIHADYVDLSGVLPEIKPRPAVPSIYLDAAPAPYTLDMDGLPAGFTITATNEAGEAVVTDDPADPIILADAETYIVRIDPPWPYLAETLTIEVT